MVSKHFQPDKTITMDPVDQSPRLHNPVGMSNGGPDDVALSESGGSAVEAVVNDTGGSNPEVSAPASVSAESIDGYHSDVYDDHKFYKSRRSVSYRHNKYQNEEVRPRVDVLYVLETVLGDGSVNRFIRDTPFAGVNLNPLDTTVNNDNEESAVVTIGVDVKSPELWRFEGNNINNWWKKPSTIDRYGPLALSGSSLPWLRIGSRKVKDILKSMIDYDPTQPSAEFDVHLMGFTGYYAGLQLYYDELHSIYMKHVQAMEDESQREAAMDGIFDHGGLHLNAFWEEYGRTENPIDNWDEATCKDIAILLRMLGPLYSKKICPAVQKLQLSHPQIEFSNLLALYKPGTIVYKREGDRVVALVVVRAFELERQSTAQVAPCVVEAWYYEYDGSFVRRTSTKSRIESYKGDRAVLTLPLIPAKIYDRNDGGEARRHIMERGKRMLEIIRLGFAHRFYEHPKSSYRGQIIIDQAIYNQRFLEKQAYGDQYRAFENLPYDVEFDDDYDRISKQSEPTDDRGYKRFSTRHEIDASKSEQLDMLLPDGVMFLTSRVGGIALATKKFMRFEVDGISSSPPWKSEKQLESCLVIANEEDREILRTVPSNTAIRSPIQADFVQGKGEGQVFLLHGPPGTGKTLTAECVANDTQRPLISLTHSDIGVFRLAEIALRMWFDHAAKWGAILLIDEADVFLEKRSAGSAHNYLVTVFLRTMEYYAGILFLTTNRPGQIDDSFISRVTASIRYTALTQESRNSIWQKFFTMHEKTTPLRVKITTKAKKELRLDTTELNGREIRNIFQNAIHLASLPSTSDDDEEDKEDESGNSAVAARKPKVIWVDWDHFSKALERHKSFKDYLNTVNRNMDEHKRNAMRANY